MSPFGTGVRPREAVGRGVIETGAGLPRFGST